MRVFEVMGPVMVGPSSSHTAGAARIGRLARAVLGETPVRAKVLLHGSFAATGQGHGTDRALAGGLLGMGPGDRRLKDGLEEARRQGVELHLEAADLGEVHPNTVHLSLTGRDGRTAEVTAASVGGGKAVITEVDGFSVRLEVERPTLLVFHQDRPGEVAHATAVLAEEGINISAMQVTRLRRGGAALMAIETDRPVPAEALARIAARPGVERVRALEAPSEEGD